MRKPALLITACVLLLMTACSTPQPQPAATTAPAKEAAPAAQVHGTLLQVMRGVVFPNSNVIFAVQGNDPTKMKPAKDPATSTDPLLSTYGGWTAVENSGIALAESANLLIVPGRKCSNGKDVPLNNPDWPQLVQGLRDAGMKVYQAGQSKNDDKVLEAADAMTTACANCHDKYRDKPGGDAERCM
jgi:hypothetical protein